MALRVPDEFTVVEVMPRDGLQSLARIYPTDAKVELVDMLSDTGVPKIEVSTFARPDIVPQLADAEEVFARIRRRPGVVYRGLVPNKRGAERAVAAGVGEILGLITASPTYNWKNSHMSIEDNLVEVAEIADIARQAGVPMLMAIGVCTFCPYEGDVPPARVMAMIEQMWSGGIEEFYLGISVGVDGPRRIYELAYSVLERWPDLRLGLHMHNTNGMALANAIVGLQAGVRVFEGSISGIGGGIRMPLGMPHYGNVATEDLVEMFHEMDIRTGIDAAMLIDVARHAKSILGLDVISSYAAAGATKAAVRERARAAIPEA